MYCTYLRKSRSDLEAERHGQGETLTRHREELNRLAARMNIIISKEYAEVVSGETIVSRPVMQQLLRDVEQGMYEGVLVVEVERLARGDTMDQGLVSQTFKYSNTKIITPLKTYDPNKESDEEYFEFGLFMSRREYKTINRRLNEGRIRSVHEGKYVGNKAPYGYARYKLPDEKGYSLKIIPDEAETVKLAYDMYVNQGLGMTTIAYRLNDMGSRPTYAKEWTTSSIKDLLQNETYIGRVRWNRRKTVKKMVNGVVEKSRPRSDDYISVQGMHEAIIPEFTFFKAQTMIKSKRVAHPRNCAALTNPLCGLIICEKCGRRMQQRPKGPRQREDVIMCTNHLCDNKASYTYLIEKRILDSLSEWINEYQLKFKDAPVPSDNVVRELSIEKLEAEYTSIQDQINRCCDMLEKKIYTQALFSQRYSVLNDRLQEIEKKCTDLRAAIKKDEATALQRKTVIPKICNLLETYDTLSAEAKNSYLKELIECIYYNKDVKGHGHEDEFSLKIRPLIK